MNNLNEYKNRFYTLMESNMGNVKPLIMEQGLPNGYEDITKWFETPEGQIYLPDGKYTIGQGQVCNKDNCVFTIQTNDNKETGYAIGPDFKTASALRSIPYVVEISQNGMSIAYGVSYGLGTNLKIYLNQSVLDSSGLSTKKS
jgi:hypothetical protein